MTGCNLSYHQKQHVLGRSIQKFAEIMQSSTRETRHHFTATPPSSMRRHHFDAAFPYAPSDDFTSDAFLYAPLPTRVRRSSTHVNYAPRSSTRRRSTSRPTLNSAAAFLYAPSPPRVYARQHLRRRAIACTGQSTRRAW